MPAFSEDVNELVAFDGRAARLLGPAASGKTSTLLRRATRLGEAGGGVLFITSPGARATTIDSLLELAPAVSPLVRVTTWHGLARSVVGAQRPNLRFASAAECSHLIASIIGRPVDSIAVTRTIRAINDLRASWMAREEIVTHAAAAGVENRWSELADLSEHYDTRLQSASAFDSVGAILQATLLLRDPSVRTRLAYDHVIVDDHESATFAEHRLLTTIASPTDPSIASVVVCGNPEGPTWGGTSSRKGGGRWLRSADRNFAIELDVAIVGAGRDQPDTDVVGVSHRSLLGEAIAGEVGALLAAGVPDSEIAIVVAPGSSVEHRVSAAARRHGIAIAARRRPCGTDPVVAAVVAIILRSSASPWPDSAEALGLTSNWFASRTGDSSPASVAFDAWLALAPRLLGLDRTENVACVTGRHPSVAALRTFIDALATSPDHGPVDALVQSAANATVASTPGIALVTDDETRGRRWQAVIATGFEEGIRPPRPSSSIPFYDPELLRGPDVPEVNERHRRTLVEARARFEFLKTRATETFIAISSPEPGVLTSRFIESAGPPRSPRPALRIHAPLNHIPESANSQPFWPETVRGSASSLEMFLNCPLQFTFRYVLGIDTPSGVQAAVGTLVHSILEEFLSPNHPTNRSKERLAELIAAHWNDEMFTYRAQASEYRTRVTTMLLTTWFDSQGAATTSVAKVEHHFEITVGGHTLTGYIDRIDRHRTTEGISELEVIDYKTGSWKSAKAGEDNLQLGTYYLAARRDPELAALGTPTKLRLHFIEAGKDAWQTIGPDHEAQWEGRITDVFEAIEAESRQPSPEADCEYCDFQRVCPIQRHGRRVPLSPSAQRHAP